MIGLLLLFGGIALAAIVGSYTGPRCWPEHVHEQIREKGYTDGL